MQPVRKLIPDAHLLTVRDRRFAAAVQLLPVVEV
jgi:hypothetical protein